MYVTTVHTTVYIIITHVQCMCAYLQSSITTESAFAGTKPSLKTFLHPQ